MELPENFYPKNKQTRRKIKCISGLTGFEDEKDWRINRKYER
jgi:hypothetical protein